MFGETMKANTIFREKKYEPYLIAKIIQIDEQEFYFCFEYRGLSVIKDGPYNREDILYLWPFFLEECDKWEQYETAKKV